ncbi:MAG: CPXCG motif-containing cysteine-rich protein [Planctomycetota bacterium]|nr:CPXCG motif-containing cysteine-rich protein [Planctomycetota bacterium]
MQDEAEYVCDACGEGIVIPVDLTQGARQQYGEDCPVCCRPHLITIEVDAEGHVRAWAVPD